MLLTSQPQIWFSHTRDPDILRRAYSTATYKPEEPTWITMLCIVHEIAGRLCVFPFTQPMNNPCWTLIIVTPYQINHQYPTHLPPVKKKNRCVTNAWRERQRTLPTTSQTLSSLQHISCITQLHGYNKLQTWVRIITAFHPLQLNTGLFSQRADNRNFSKDRVLTLKSKQCSSREGTCWIQSQPTIPMMVMVVIQRTVIIRLCLGSNQFQCGCTLFWVWITRIALLTRRLCLQWRVRVAFVLPNGKLFLWFSYV